MKNKHVYVNEEGTYDGNWNPLRFYFYATCHINTELFFKNRLHLQRVKVVRDRVYDDIWRK